MKGIFVGTGRYSWPLRLIFGRLCDEMSRDLWSGAGPVNSLKGRLPMPVSIFLYQSRHSRGRTSTWILFSVFLAFKKAMIQSL